MMSENDVPTIGPRIAEVLDPAKLAPVEETYSAYAELRSKCPVAFHEGSGGFYTLTRYDDVRDAAMNWKTFSSAQGVFLPRDISRGPLPAIEMDRPQHAPWRKLFTDAVAKDVLASLEPVLTALADSVIDRFAGDGGCDLLTSFAEPYPILGMCHTIGLGSADPDAILDIGHEFSTRDPARQAVAYQRASALVLAEIQDRRREPRDDYLTRLALAEPEGQLIDDNQMMRFMMGFLVAGHETTASALSSLAYHALTRPDVKERILEDDDAMAAAIEETVRLNSPIHSFVRTATCPAAVGDVEIPEGSAVQLYFAAANRDPAAFDRPDEFDIDRPVNPHLGFGAGRHLCAGAPLARNEIRIALRQLFTRLPDIRLTDSEVQWEFAVPTLVRPKSLNVTFSAT
jgi:cytochrome P450